MGIASSTATQRPWLFPDLEDVYRSFFLIGAGRQFNETGAQPLLLTEISAYLNERQVVDLDERAEFHHYVRVLDRKFLQLSHDKMARDREALSAKYKSGKGRKGR